MVGGGGENLEWKEWRVDVMKIIACKKFSIKERNLNIQFLKKKKVTQKVYVNPA